MSRYRGQVADESMTLAHATATCLHTTCFFRWKQPRTHSRRTAMMPDSSAAARPRGARSSKARLRQQAARSSKSKRYLPYQESQQKLFKPTPPSRCSSGTLRISTSGSFQTQPGVPKSISQASTNDTEAKCETKHKNVAIARDTGPSRRMCVGLHLSD